MSTFNGDIRMILEKTNLDVQDGPTVTRKMATFEG